MKAKCAFNRAKVIARSELFRKGDRVRLTDEVRQRAAGRIILAGWDASQCRSTGVVTDARRLLMPEYVVVQFPDFHLPIRCAHASLEKA